MSYLGEPVPFLNTGFLGAAFNLVLSSYREALKKEGDAFLGLSGSGNFSVKNPFVSDAATDIEKGLSLKHIKEMLEKSVDTHQAFAILSSSTRDSALRDNFYSKVNRYPEAFAQDFNQLLEQDLPTNTKSPVVEGMRIARNEILRGKNQVGVFLEDCPALLPHLSDQAVAELSRRGATGGQQFNENTLKALGEARLRAEMAKRSNWFSNLFTWSEAGKIQNFIRSFVESPGPHDQLICRTLAKDYQAQLVSYYQYQNFFDRTVTNDNDRDRLATISPYFEKVCADERGQQKTFQECYEPRAYSWNEMPGSCFLQQDVKASSDYVEPQRAQPGALAEVVDETQGYDRLSMESNGSTAESNSSTATNRASGLWLEDQYGSDVKPEGNGDSMPQSSAARRLDFGSEVQDVSEMEGSTSNSAFPSSAQVAPTRSSTSSTVPVGVMRTSGGGVTADRPEGQRSEEQMLVNPPAPVRKTDFTFDEKMNKFLHAEESPVLSDLFISDALSKKTTFEQLECFSQCETLDQVQYLGLKLRDMGIANPASLASSLLSDSRLAGLFEDYQGGLNLSAAIREFATGEQLSELAHFLREDSNEDCHKVIDARRASPGKPSELSAPAVLVVDDGLSEQGSALDDWDEEESESQRSAQESAQRWVEGSASHGSDQESAQAYGDQSFNDASEQSSAKDWTFSVDNSQDLGSVDGWQGEDDKENDGKNLNQAPPHRALSHLSFLASKNRAEPLAFQENADAESRFSHSL